RRAPDTTNIASPRQSCATAPIHWPSGGTFAFLPGAWRYMHHVVARVTAKKVWSFKAIDREPPCFLLLLGTTASLSFWRGRPARRARRFPADAGAFVLGLMTVPESILGLRIFLSPAPQIPAPRTVVWPSRI